MCHIQTETWHDIHRTLCSHRLVVLIMGLDDRLFIHVLSHAECASHDSIITYLSHMILMLFGCQPCGHVSLHGDVIFDILLFMLKKNLIVDH